MTQQLWVFVDVDGTLIDQDDNARPWIAELFEGIHTLGGCIVVWSGGGEHYARLQLNRLGETIAGQADAVIGKGSAFVTDARRFYIDDAEELVKVAQRGGHGTYLLPFFHADTMEGDDHLLRALHAIRTYCQAVA